MSKTKEVETSLGIFEVIKPKAGVRNRAMASAESETGVLKYSTMMMVLLPKCINRRPEGLDQEMKIDHVLDGLEIEDYDALITGLAELISGETISIEEKKKQSTDI
jgi:hypothetical protein